MKGVVAKHFDTGIKNHIQIRRVPGRWMDDWCVRYLARSDGQFSCNSQIICGRRGQIMHARQGGEVGAKS